MVYLIYRSRIFGSDWKMLLYLRWPVWNTGAPTLFKSTVPSATIAFSTGGFSEVDILNMG